MNIASAIAGQKRKANDVVKKHLHIPTSQTFRRTSFSAGYICSGCKPAEYGSRVRGDHCHSVQRRGPALFLHTVRKTPNHYRGDKPRWASGSHTPGLAGSTPAPAISPHENKLSLDQRPGDGKGLRFQSHGRGSTSTIVAIAVIKISLSSDGSGSITVARVVLLLQNIFAGIKNPASDNVLPPRENLLPPRACGGQKFSEATKGRAMSISTAYGPTPFSTDELAALHGVAGSRAKQIQEHLDALIVEVFGPAYVARGVRADQAAESIRCLVRRLHRMFTGDREQTKRHVTRLVKLAYDQAAIAELTAITKRLPATSGNQYQPQKRAIA